MIFRNKHHDPGESFREFKRLLEDRKHVTDELGRDVARVLFQGLLRMTQTLLQKNKFYNEKVLFDFSKCLELFKGLFFLAKDVRNAQRILNGDNPGSNLLSFCNEYLHLEARSDFSKNGLHYIETRQELKFVLRMVAHKDPFENLRQGNGQGVTTVSDIEEEVLNEKLKHEIVEESNVQELNDEIPGIYTKGLEKNLTKLLSSLDFLVNRKQNHSGSSTFDFPVKRDSVESFYHAVEEESLIDQHKFSSFYLSKKFIENKESPVDILNLHFKRNSEKPVNKVAIGQSFGRICLGFQNGTIKLVSLNSFPGSSEHEQPAQMGSVTPSERQMEKIGSYCIPTLSTSLGSTPNFSLSRDPYECSSGFSQQKSNETRNTCKDTYITPSKMGVMGQVEVGFSSQEAKALNEEESRKSDWVYENPNFKKFKLTGHSGAITSLSFSSDESQLLSGSTDKTIRLWSLSHNQSPICQQVFKMHLKTIWDIQFAARGSYFISGGEEGLALFWSLSDPTPLCAMKHNAGVKLVRLTHSLKYAITYSMDLLVQVWELKPGASPIRVLFADFFVSTMTLNLNADTLFLGYENGQVQAWNIDKVKKLRTIDSFSKKDSSVNAICFSSSEKKLMVSTPHGIGFFNAEEFRKQKPEETTEGSDYFARNKVEPERLFLFGENKGQPEILNGLFHTMNFAVVITSSAQGSLVAPLSN